MRLIINLHARNVTRLITRLRTMLVARWIIRVHAMNVTKLTTRLRTMLVARFSGECTDFHLVCMHRLLRDCKCAYDG